MVKLWARIGMVLDLTTEELEIIKKANAEDSELEDIKGVENVMRKVFNEGRMELAGESYAPNAQEQLDEDEMNYEEDELWLGEFWYTP